MMDWNTELGHAAKKGNVNSIERCLQNAANINFKTGDGWTALMFASAEGQHEATQLLLRRGCNINDTNVSGWTALMIAAMGGHFEVTRLLLDGGCLKDIKSGDELTACMWSASGGFLDVTRLLIERGCDKFTEEKNGKTALHLAAESGHPNVTKYLVEKAGFSPLSATKQGKTPYDLADSKQKGKYKEVKQYLQVFMSELILTKLSQLNRDDFHDLVAKGTFASFENRVFLAGPCNIGKSSLASILIDEAIPKTWCSTDGLIIHFGRNGIDLQTDKMIPLKKVKSDILTKLLLGNPELRTQQSRIRTPQTKKLSCQTKQYASLMKEGDDEYDEKVEYDPRYTLQNSSNKKFGASNENANAKSRQTSFGQQPYMKHKPDLEPQKNIQKSKHTADSIQDGLLEKIMKKSYSMSIAPSDLVDFGGQKSFDMTHQLFIQQRGTFVLMFDGFKGLYTELKEYPQGGVTAASILEHWVNSILTYSNTTEDKMPRIVFAATHSDSFSEDEKRKLTVQFQGELRSMFSSHKLHEHIMYKIVFFINATDGDDLGICQLKDALVKIAYQQSTWGQQMPMVWVPLDLQISDMRAEGLNLITKEKLLKINKANGELTLEERRFEDFLLVQHSIGKLLYFDEPMLRNIIVIQPTAMVNILRAFITDIMFWPEEGQIRDILQSLSSTGVLKKTDLFTLWSQPAFNDILNDSKTKEYVVNVLLHLDILVEPKRYTDKETAACVFLVPCIVKINIPKQLQNQARDEKTICIAYHLKETVVPSALSFKLIGAALNIWPLKVVNSRFCLYFQAAIMEIDHRNDLQIYVEGQRIFAYLINDVSKQLISPDLATTTQECLTLALERILQFYNRCFGKQSNHELSDLFDIEVGEICNGKTCLIPLSEAKQQEHWRCKNGNTHHTNCPLKWVFDKTKKHCDVNCKGFETETENLTPDDQHFVQLARTLGIGDFYNFFIELGMEKTDYDNLHFRYFSNPMDFMLMGLFEWRDRTESDELTTTFGKLLAALTAIDRQHYLCQVHREDHTLVVKAHSRLQDIPSDEVINFLTEKKLIGDCIVHLGVELALSIGNIKETLHNFPRNLNGQIHDLLTKWKNCKEPNMVKPTIYRLMNALKRIKAARALNFMKKTYDVV